MVTLLDTNKEQMIINVEVVVKTPTTIRVILEDNDNPNTVLTNRFRYIEDKDTFLIRLPIVGKTSKLTVYDENLGLQDKDTTFEVVSITKDHLKKRLDIIDVRSPGIKSFLNFSQRFSFNAGWLGTDPNKSYKSDDGKYQIIYVDAILDEKGNDIGTPACIYENGLIECDARFFVPATVPMREAILLHEFSHIFLNNNPADESEADINGLCMYLSLGFPRVEAVEAWVETFWIADVPENIERQKIMMQFIEDFENNNMIIYGKY